MADRPIHEIRLGRVKVAVWRNDTDNGPRHNVTFQRIYRSDNGWESTTSFGRDDLPLLAKVADLAHTWIYQEARESADGDSSADEKPEGQQKERGRQNGQRRATAR
jgi:hypothetical protein